MQKPTGDRVRPLNTRLKIATLVVGALAVAGCGGGGGTTQLSKSQYEQKIKEEGQSLQAAFTALDLNTNKNLKDLAAKIGKLQTKLEQTANDFDLLKPPNDAVGDNKKIALTLHRFADIFGELQKAAQERAVLDGFAPDFIPSLFRGENRVFTRPADMEHLLDGLRLAAGEGS